MSIGMGNYGGQQGPPKEVKETAKEQNKSVIGHTLKVIGEIAGKPHDGKPHDGKPGPLTFAVHHGK